MRTTVDLPPDLVQRAMKASGAKTKREAICRGLKELVRNEATEELLARRHKVDFRWTAEEIEERQIRADRKERGRRR